MFLLTILCSPLTVSSLFIFTHCVHHYSLLTPCAGILVVSVMATDHAFPNLQWWQPDRESMVPEQAIHEGILRLHHPVTSTEHSSWVEERYEGEHCELCASMQELYVCLS